MGGLGSEGVGGESGWKKKTVEKKDWKRKKRKEN